MWNDEPVRPEPVGADGSWNAKREYPLIWEGYMDNVRFASITDLSQTNPLFDDSKLCPVFSYELDGDTVKSVTVSASAESTRIALASYDNIYRVAALALSQTNGISPLDYWALRFKMERKAPFDSYTITQGNITVTVNVEYSGMQISEDNEQILTYEVGDEPCSFAAEFTVSVAGE